MAEPSPDFVGRFEGEDMRQNLPANKTFVRAVDVTLKDGVFLLEGRMVTTNRETGMDHISNTNWEWKGTGRLRNGSVQFTYTTAFETARGRGYLRSGPDGKMILILDGISYRLVREKSSPTSNQTMQPTADRYEK